MPLSACPVGSSCGHEPRSGPPQCDSRVARRTGGDTSTTSRHHVLGDTTRLRSEEDRKSRWPLIFPSPRMPSRIRLAGKFTVLVVVFTAR